MNGKPGVLAAQQRTFDVVYGSGHPPVSSVLELARADAYAEAKYEWGDKLAQARATVERLAEAAQFVLDKEWEYGEDQPACARLNDALAAFNGEQP